LGAKHSTRNSHKPNRPQSHSKIIGRPVSGEFKMVRPKNKPRKSSQTRVKVKYGRIAAICFVLLFAFWSIKPLFSRIEQKQEQVKLEKQLAQIKKDNQKLREEVNYANSNDYVEQEARSLGLSKPNEEVVVVVPQGNKEKLKAKENKVEKNDEKKASNSMWDRIIDFISNVF
jgi:cell division protein FtsB